MLWQDWVFSVGTWVFAIALVPTIRGKEKPPLWTSFPTAIFLTLFALTYFSLTLWLSAFSSLLTATAWSILAIQKLQQTKND
jgi:hypothetical protein